jgi:hypothetical protein
VTGTLPDPLLRSRPHHPRRSLKPDSLIFRVTVVVVSGVMSVIAGSVGTMVLFEGIADGRGGSPDPSESASSTDVGAPPPETQPAPDLVRDVREREWATIARRPLDHIGQGFVLYIDWMTPSAEDPDWYTTVASAYPATASWNLIGESVVLVDGGGLTDEDVSSLLGFDSPYRVEAVVQAEERVQNQPTAVLSVTAATPIEYLDLRGDVSIERMPARPPREAIGALGARITNRSTGPAGYIIEVEIVTPDGQRSRLGTATITTQEPGETGFAQIIGSRDVPPDVTFEVVRVDRLPVIS